MTQARPARFYWRIVPVLVATPLLTGVLAYGWHNLRATTGPGMGEFVSVLMAAGLGAVVFLLPAVVVWTIGFNWLGPGFFAPRMAPLWANRPRPVVWRRAVWASILTGITVPLATMLLMEVQFAPSGLWDLVPLAGLALLVLAVLTWAVFRGVAEPEFRGRE